MPGLACHRRPMDQSHPSDSTTAIGGRPDRSLAGPPVRATTRVVLTLLAAVMVAALSAAHADAAIASRTSVKRKTPKATATTRPIVTTTTKLAAATPPKAATGSKVGACDLVTGAEAEAVLSATNLVADATSTALACAYRRNGVGSPVVLISITGFSTKELFGMRTGGATSRAIPLPGLAEAAYRSADWSQIEFLKGKTAVLIIMNVIDANGTFSGPDEDKALDAARVAASRV